jgi:hypothetical protein
MAANQLPNAESEERAQLPQPQFAEGGNPDHRGGAVSGRRFKQAKPQLADYTLLMKQARQGRA